MGFEFLDLFQAAIGIYLLVYGILGKGKVYENEYIKEGCEKKYHTTMRVFLLVLGPLAMLGAFLSLFNLDKTGGKLVMIFWGLTLLGFIVLIILTARLTSRNKALPTTKDGKPYKNPAFDFDEEDSEENASGKNGK